MLYQSRFMSDRQNNNVAGCHSKSEFFKRCQFLKRIKSVTFGITDVEKNLGILGRYLLIYEIHRHISVNYENIDQVVTMKKIRLLISITVTILIGYS